MQPNVISPNQQPQGPPPDGYAMMGTEISSMDSQNKNPQFGPHLSPPATVPGPSSDGRFKSLFKKRGMLITAILLVGLLANIALSAWLYHKVGQYSTLTALGLNKTGNNVFNGDETLYLNTKTKAVGVGAQTPDGLQVNSLVSQTARGQSNVRFGLMNGEPTGVFEDKNANQWSIGLSGGNFQIGQPDNVVAILDKDTLTDNKNLKVLGDTTFGDKSTDSVTLQAATLLAPNNLTIGNTALFIDTAKNSLAVGAKSANGYKLYVAGNVRVTSSLQADGQIIGPAGSAKTPSISFANGTGSGIFSPSPNVISISANGTETLKVQSGSVSTVNGAGLNVDGFLQAGTGGPAWKLVRFTGTLNGSGVGAVNHGISNASSRLVLAMAWYESASGTAKPLSIDFINNTTMEVSGGTPGSTPWRGVIVYTADTAGW